MARSATLGLTTLGALLQLSHGTLELARATRLERKVLAPRLSAWAAAVLARRCVQAPRRERQTAGRVLDAIVAGALTAPHERVEGGEQVEGDQHGPATQQLAVVTRRAAGRSSLSCQVSPTPSS